MHVRIFGCMCNGLHYTLAADYQPIIISYSPFRSILLPRGFFHSKVVDGSIIYMLTKSVAASGVARNYPRGGGYDFFCSPLKNIIQEW